MNRILKADAIFTGKELISGDHLLVISPEGKVVEILKERKPEREVEQFKGMLCPGFVNVHCHLELSHLKGKVPQHTGLPDFLYNIQKLRHQPEEEKIAAMHAAAAEMWDAGIVAVGDICNSGDTVPLKKTHPIRFYNFIEMFGLLETDAEWKINQAGQLKDIFKRELPDQPVGFTPHAPYSLSENLFQFLNQATSDSILSIHNQESAAEDELAAWGTGAFLDFYTRMGIHFQDITSTGKRSLERWLPKFNKQQRVIAVHNTETQISDLDVVKKSAGKINSFTICFCPNANLYIENRLPDIPGLMQRGFPIVLGTDSYASNTQLSIWSEIQTIQTHFPEIELPELLRWATLNAAGALGFEDSLGSFEKGKTPGILLINDGVVRRIG